MSKALSAFEQAELQKENADLRSQLADKNKSIASWAERVGEIERQLAAANKRIEEVEKLLTMMTTQRHAPIQAKENTVACAMLVPA